MTFSHGKTSKNITIRFNHLHLQMYLLEDLVDVISEYSILGFPFTPRKIRKIAYEFTEENYIDGFSGDKELAGSKWFSILLKRHAQLHVKQCITNLSLARAMD